MRSALWVVITLGIAVAVGLGVWKMMKEQREASAGEQPDDRPAKVVDRPAPVAPAPVPAPLPENPDDPSVKPPAPPQTVAESRAQDPMGGAVIGTAGGDDGLDSMAIAKTLSADTQRLTACGEGKPTGKVRVTLTLNRRGGVTTATADGSALGDCLAAELKKLRWGKAFDGAQIVVPFEFSEVCDEVSCVLNNYEPSCCNKFYKGPPRPLAESPSGEGLPESLGREEISTAVGAVKGQIIACGEASAFRGVIKARVHVTPQGAPDVRSLDNAPADLAPCMKRALTGAKFPMSRSGVSFSYPFVF